MSEPKYTKKEIEEAFQAECPYFYELQATVQQNDNAVIALQVRKHNGKMTDYVVTVSKRTVVK